MKPAAESDAALERQAATWLARRGAGWSTVEAEAFAAWRAADPRREAAVVRMESAERFLARLPELPATAALWAEADALARPRARLIRFPAWARAVAAAAAVLVATAGGWQYASRASDFSSLYAAEDSVRRLTLPDGSEIRLSAASVLEVNFTRRERQLLLSQGEAYFDVAHEAKRSFQVTAGALAVSAIGTVFSVHHRDENSIEVIVTEGKVRVTPQASAGLARPGMNPVELLLSAGERVVWEADRGGGLPVLAPRPVELAVGDEGTPVPRLTFQDTPLIEAVAAFNRHSRVRLEVGDPLLAERAVGGSFSADAAESFAALLAAGGDIQLERPAPDRIILRQAP